MLDSNTCSSAAPSFRVICLAGAVNLAWEDWLNLRKCGIVNSEAASVVGLDPGRSPLALWLAKTG